MPFFFDAAILSRMRSPVTSRWPLFQGRVDRAPSKSG
jgi:hypothetical protein